MSLRTCFQGLRMVARVDDGGSSFDDQDLPVASDRVLDPLPPAAPGDPDTLLEVRVLLPERDREGAQLLEDALRARPGDWVMHSRRVPGSGPAERS
ncbi:hypothetical protein [Frankia sp. R43]|uniref:hypothetical protein n=1 Tax=Frankia sp. R43 TaxID=269536 RepID=UPI000A488339|nr:hypothetical protein [Frankia sp. R43]